MEMTEYSKVDCVAKRSDWHFRIMMFIVFAYFIFADNIDSILQPRYVIGFILFVLIGVLMQNREMAREVVILQSKINGIEKQGLPH